jgi:hypothetical protein
LFDLACNEALNGERDAALDHLREAVEADPKYRDYAAKDADFDSVRDDPRFPS